MTKKIAPLVQTAVDDMEYAQDGTGSLTWTPERVREAKAQLRALITVARAAQRLCKTKVLRWQEVQPLDRALARLVRASQRKKGRDGR